MSSTEHAAIEAEVVGSSASGTKKTDWRSKAMAPVNWVETLLSGTRSPPDARPRSSEAMAVLVVLRSGRRGSGFLIGTLPFDTVGFDATDSVAPLAAECWEFSKEKVAEIGDGKTYCAMLKVCETDETGATHVVAESEWHEVDDDGLGGEGEAWEAVGKGEPYGLAGQLIRVLGAQNKELFRANISLVRASAFLLRESIHGQADRLNADFATIKQVREIEQQMFDTRTELAQQEADAKEVEELGKTAREWMGLAHEDRLAERGVKTPPVPTTRADAGRGLWQSLNMGQLNKLRELLGPEKSAAMLALLENASTLNDAQIEELLAAQMEGPSAVFELMDVATKVFSSEFAPASYAIWQTRCLRVLLEGPKAEAA